MLRSLLRLYFYCLAGLFACLLGWNIYQAILTDLAWLRTFPELVIFPCMAISLSLCMVITDIFLSTPARPKLSWRIARQPLLLAGVIGLFAGLIAGGLSQLLFVPNLNLPEVVVRILGWLLVGTSVGLAEGWAWSLHSQEAGGKKQFVRRLLSSLLGSFGVSLVAALLFEVFRLGSSQDNLEFARYEDLIGFSFLGIGLGAVFTFTTSPSYLAALRAGSGFEFTDEDEDDLGFIDRPVPHIHKTRLKFVTQDSDYDTQIQEGLSIQLTASAEITIGSDLDADISIPGLPKRLATLVIDKREARIKPEVRHYKLIEVDGKKLRTAYPIRLKHNTLITFRAMPNPNPEGTDTAIESEASLKEYRFVYYNRFLDPQA